MLNTFATLMLAVALLADSLPAALLAQTADRLVLPLTPDTGWWTGVVVHGHQMPVRPGYVADLRANTYGVEVGLPLSRDITEA